MKNLKGYKMRWVGHKATWDRREKCTRFWCETPKERDHLEDRGDGRWDQNGS
jgi:hypothetical protein